jgi:predicted nuclease of restriction endonuclease-like (RecB) superfamily
MTTSISTNNSDYFRFLNDIKSRIKSSRIQATRIVNRELIGLYWNIGKIIVERQEKFGWGKAIVVTLSKDIRKEFPGISGYSPDNLWRMRQFYVEYSDTQILEQLVPELMQLVKREVKTRKNKFSFLEQLVPVIQNTAGKKIKEEVKKEWALQIMPQLVERIPWGQKRRQKNIL